MNTTRSIGILLDQADDNKLDRAILDQIKDYIIKEANILRAKRGIVFKTALAKALGIHRNRMTRISEALEITYIFD